MTRRCLVLGSATCLWDDIDAALALGEFDAVIAAKQAGIVWPGELYSWVSLHPDWMKDYREQRRAKGYPEPREVVSHAPNPAVDRIADPKWPEQRNRSGASGMFAVKVAKDDGFDRIVGCGIPMLRTIDRIDGRKGWTSSDRYQQAVLMSKHRIENEFRSMSGWTREQFGAPTQAWLEG